MSEGSEWFETNRANWDERVPIHTSGDFYDVEGFKKGDERLRPFEVEEVGDVAGKSLLHLQCHFGMDTLDWARRGAKVVGLDFSKPAVEAARRLASDMGEIGAEFVESNVYDAREALGGRTFDIVYTGLGALNWLPDIEKWAEAASSLVKPGGFLYVSEFHPFTEVFGDDGLTVEHDYFRDEPMVWDDPGTYADLEAETVNNKTFEWNHGLGEVVSAVVSAGLSLELLHEHDFTLFPRWPILEKSGFDTYRLPEGVPKIPLMYSMKAEKRGVGI